MPSNEAEASSSDAEEDDETLTQIPPPTTDAPTPAKPPKPSKKSAFELHRFLYQTQTVFSAQDQGSSQSVTLQPGDHAYPFSIRIPENVACDMVAHPASPNFERLDMGTKPKQVEGGGTHTLGGLPSSLSDMDKTASVKYFLKATVVRASVLKKNMRVFHQFRMDPHQAPPVETAVAEVVAREKLQLQVLESWPWEWPPEPKKKKSWNIFKLKKKPPTRPIAVALEMRYLSNAAFVPGQQIPVKMFVSVTLPEGAHFYNTKFVVQRVSIRLQATTELRAHEYETTETQHLSVIDTQKDLNFTVDWTKGTRSRQGTNDVWTSELPSELWEDAVIPESVAPSFAMCTIRRKYSLEISAGLAGGPDCRIESVSVSTLVNIVPKQREPWVHRSASMPVTAPPPPVAIEQWKSTAPVFAPASVPNLSRQPQGLGPGSGPGSGSAPYPVKAPVAPPYPMQPRANSVPGPGPVPVQRVQSLPVSQHQKPHKQRNQHAPIMPPIMYNTRPSRIMEPQPEPWMIPAGTIPRTIQAGTAPVPRVLPPSLQVPLRMPDEPSSNDRIWMPSIAMPSSSDPYRVPLEPRASAHDNAPQLSSESSAVSPAKRNTTVKRKPVRSMTAEEAAVWGSGPLVAGPDTMAPPPSYQTVQADAVASQNGGGEYRSDYKA